MSVCRYVSMYMCVSSPISHHTFVKGEHMKQYHHAILASKGASNSIKIYFGGKSNGNRFTAASTQTSPSPLEPTQTTKRCRDCGHLRRHRTIAPSSGPLEFGSNGSETWSFRLNQTTPQQWLTNRRVAWCTEIFLH